MADSDWVDSNFDDETSESSEGEDFSQINDEIPLTKEIPPEPESKMAGLGIQIASQVFSTDVNINNNYEQSLSYELINSLEYNILYLNFSKLLIFLESDNDSEVCFPFITKRYQDILKRIALDFNILKSESLDEKYRDVCDKILHKLIENQDVFKLVCAEENRKDLNNVLVCKKYFFNPREMLLPPSPLSTSTRSLDSQEDSDSNPPRKFYRPGSVNKDFKLHCLKTALAFVKNDAIKTLEFPNLNFEQETFINTLLNTVVGYVHFESHFGVKDLYRALWEAIKIYSLKYNFRVKTEIRGDKKWLEFTKVPKPAPVADKNPPKKKIVPEPKKKLTKIEKRTTRINNIKLLVDSLPPPLITETLERVTNLLANENEASHIFKPKSEQESEFYAYILRWARNMLTRPLFSEKDGRLLDRINELLSRNKCNVEPAKKNQRYNKSGFKPITFKKLPKIPKASKSQKKSKKDVKLLREDSEYSDVSTDRFMSLKRNKNVRKDDYVNDGSTDRSVKRKKSKRKRGKQDKSCDDNTNSSAGSNERASKTLEIQKQILIKSNYYALKVMQITDLDMHFVQSLSKKARRKLNKRLGLQQAPPDQQPPQQEPLRRSQRLAALLPTPPLKNINPVRMYFKPASTKLESVIPDLYDSYSNTPISDRRNVGTRHEWAPKTIADVPKHIRDAIPERFRVAPKQTTSWQLMREDPGIYYGPPTIQVANRLQQLLQAMSVPVQSEKALRMMKGMGWSGGALGVRGDGIMEPLIPVLNIRKGRGFGHFESRFNIKPLMIHKTIPITKCVQQKIIERPISKSNSNKTEGKLVKNKICTWNIIDYVNEVTAEAKRLAAPKMIEAGVSTSKSTSKIGDIDKKVTKTTASIVEEINKPKSIGDKIALPPRTLSIASFIEINQSKSMWTISNFKEIRAEKPKDVSRSSHDEGKLATKSETVSEGKLAIKPKTISKATYGEENVVARPRTRSKSTYVEENVVAIPRTRSNSTYDEENVVAGPRTRSKSTYVEENVVAIPRTRSNSTYGEENVVARPRTRSKSTYVEENVVAIPRTRSNSTYDEENVVAIPRTRSNSTYDEENVVARPRTRSKSTYVEENVVAIPRTRSKSTYVEENVVAIPRTRSNSTYDEENVVARPRTRSKSTYDEDYVFAIPRTRSKSTHGEENLVAKPRTRSKFTYDEEKQAGRPKTVPRSSHVVEKLSATPSTGSKSTHDDGKVAKKPKSMWKALHDEEKQAVTPRTRSNTRHDEEKLDKKHKTSHVGDKVPSAPKQSNTKSVTPKEGTKRKPVCKWILDNSFLAELNSPPPMNNDVIVAKTKELLQGNYSFENLMKIQNAIPKTPSFRQELLMAILELLSSKDREKVFKYKTTINKKNINFMASATHNLGNRERISLSPVEQCFADAVFEKYKTLPGVIVSARLLSANEILLTKVRIKIKGQEITDLDAWIGKITEENFEPFIESLKPTCLTKKGFMLLSFKIRFLFKILFFLKTDDDDLDVTYDEVLNITKRTYVEEVVQDLNTRMTSGSSLAERRVTLEIIKHVNNVYLGVMFNHVYTGFTITKSFYEGNPRDKYACVTQSTNLFEDFDIPSQSPNIKSNNNTKAAGSALIKAIEKGKCVKIDNNKTENTEVTYHVPVSSVTTYVTNEFSGDIIADSGMQCTEVTGTKYRELVDNNDNQVMQNKNAIISQENIFIEDFSDDADMVVDSEVVTHTAEIHGTHIDKEMNKANIGKVVDKTGTKNKKKNTNVTDYAINEGMCSSRDDQNVMKKVSGLEVDDVIMEDAGNIQGNQPTKNMSVEEKMKDESMIDIRSQDASMEILDDNDKTIPTEDIIFDDETDTDFVNKDLDLSDQLCDKNESLDVSVVVSNVTQEHEVVNENRVESRNFVTEKGLSKFTNVYLVPCKFPKEKLTKQQAKQIQMLISLNIGKTVGKTNELPLLKYHGFQHGALIYTCHNKKSFDWLKNTIGVAKDIKLLDIRDVQKVAIKFHCLFDFDTKYLFKMIELYNKDISTKEWVVEKSEVFDDYTIFFVKMDEYSIDFIHSADLAIFVGIDKVEFTLIWD